MKGVGGPKKVPGIIRRESREVADARPRADCACGDIACISCSKSLGSLSIDAKDRTSSVSSLSLTPSAAGLPAPIAEESPTSAAQSPVNANGTTNDKEAPSPSQDEKSSSQQQAGPARGSASVGLNAHAVSSPQSPDDRPAQPRPPSPSQTPARPSPEVSMADPLADVPNPLSTNEVNAGPKTDGSVLLPDTEPATNARSAKFRKLLAEPILDLEAVRQLSWGGIPAEVRPITWRLLLGYLPTNVDRRRATLERKRKEYRDCVPRYFDVPDSERTEYETTILRQILVDVPRTNPDVPLFQTEIVQRSLERILYIWALRHPASGYVQGINDLVTPFFQVFLSQFVDGDPALCDVSRVSPAVLDMVEADSYWCVSNMLDSIQDHYTFAQPGIQRMVRIQQAL